MTASLAITRAARIVRRGGVIAYPTEAVFGLGCLPQDRAAVERLLEVKHRSWRKGLLLIGGDLAQLERFVVLPPEPMLSAVLASWPGPVTWVLEARPPRRPWLTGGRDTLAVRLTAHPLARELCVRVGQAIVSTSANLSGRPPFTRLAPLRRALGTAVDAVVAGELGGLRSPTIIRDGRTGRVLRGG